MRSFVKSLCLLAFVALGIAGCEVEKEMCTSDEQCQAVCLAYDSNMIWSQCHEGTCRCVAKEMLECSAEKDNCAAICATYRPGTQGSCENSYCTCKEPSAEPAI